MVGQVIDEHQQAKGKLERLLDGVDGKDVKDKIGTLREQINGLKETIALKKAHLSPKAASASAPEAITFGTLTRDNITNIDEIVLAQIICELIKNPNILPRNDDDKLLTIQSAIVDIIRDTGVQNTEFKTLTASIILKKIYTGEETLHFFTIDYTIILSIEITIAILKIKEKILGDTHNEISELEQIVTGILRLPNDDCKEIVNKLFIEYVNSNDSSELIISYLSFTAYYENDWRYLIACTTENDFSQVITAKEVCRRLKIDEQIKKEIMNYHTQILTWKMLKDWTIVIVTWMLYNKHNNLLSDSYEFFKDIKNAIVAIKVAQQLMYMKFDAIKIRERKEVKPEEIQKVAGVSVIIDYLDKENDDIAIFKEYVKDAYSEKNVDYMTIEDFKAFKLQRTSPAPVPVRVRASVAAAGPASSATAGPAFPTLESSVLASPVSSALSEKGYTGPKKIAQKDPSNPVSKKFDIVGFTITKESNISSYVIQENQKEKVLEVLPPELKKKSKDVEFSKDHKKARIEFTEDLSIKVILNEINDRKDPQPTIFQTTGKKSGNPLNVWLFIVPVTYKIDENTDEPNKPYLEAINKLAEDELVKIASRMEGIKEGRQPVAQSPGGKAVVASTSQPYRTQQLSQYSSSGKSTTARQ